MPRSLWATEPGGIEQIGCVYTAQGFEFDYAGIIVGLDLRYDMDLQEWVGHPEHSFDTPVKRARGNFTEFMDKETERFVRSRME